MLIRSINYFIFVGLSGFIHPSNKNIMDYESNRGKFNLKSREFQNAVKEIEKYISSKVGHFYPCYKFNGRCKEKTIFEYIAHFRKDRNSLHPMILRLKWNREMEST